MSPRKSIRGQLKDSTAKPEAFDPLKADFRNFLWLVWKHLGLPEPTPLQYDIAHYLQHGPRRAIIAALRGVGKSWITSAFVCWLLYCNPQLKILVVSASKQRADDFTTFTLRLIHEMEILQFLRPREEQRQSKISFDVGPARPDHAPSVKSVGITGQIAGSRAHVIVADDIEVPNNSDTQTKRDFISNAVREFDAVLRPNGRILYLGTPQTEHSIYLTLTQRGYVMRIWPARYPSPEKIQKYGPWLAPYITKKLEQNPGLGQSFSSPLGGAPTNPEMFSDEDLLERELSYGRSGFSLQFQIDTTLSDAERYPLKVSDLIVLPLDPSRGPVDMAWASSAEQRLEELPNVAMSGDHYYAPIFVAKEFAPFEGSVMFVDPSGKGKDETSYAVVKMLHGRLFLTDFDAFLGGYDDKVLEAILAAAKKQAVNLILVEPNFGGGMFAQLLRAKAQDPKVGYACTIEDAEWAKMQKELRIIDTLEPVLNQHRLVVDQRLIEKDYRSVDGYPGEQAPGYRLFYQLTRITRDRGALIRDDRLDALAGAVAHWLDVMNRHTEEAAQSHRDSLLEEELERLMDNVVGGRHRFEGEYGNGVGSRSWASSTMRDN